MVASLLDELSPDASTAARVPPRMQWPIITIGKSATATTTFAGAIAGLYIRDGGSLSVEEIGNQLCRSVHLAKGFPVVAK